MAENPAQAQTAAAEPAKKKFPVKAAILLLGVLVLEAVVICSVFMLAGGPKHVNAEAAGVLDQAALAEQPVEELVIGDRFQNTRSGKMYLYDTEIYVVVKKKYDPQVQEEIKAMQAAISTDVATIFRRAEPAALTEPTLATLTRQIKVALDARFKKDEDGNSVILEVLIRKCTQLPLF